MPDLDALDTGGGSHPIGTIVMWSGLLSSIPSGWLLCDGTSGTPDLIQFFARGAPPATEAGGTEGGDFHVLTLGQLASHTHSATVGHRHEQELSSVSVAGGSTGLQGNSNAGNYVFDNENAGGNVGSSGNNGQHENKPPFFELAFIQKVSD